MHRTQFFSDRAPFLGAAQMKRRGTRGVRMIMTSANRLPSRQRAGSGAKPDAGEIRGSRWSPF